MLILPYKISKETAIRRRKEMIKRLEEMIESNSFGTDCVFEDLTQSLYRFDTLYQKSYNK